jgi:hypothetical protein
LVKAAVATLSTLLVVLSACGEALSPSSGLPYAAASYGCGPAGGQTTVIVLASEPIQSITGPPVPYASVVIAQSPSQIAAGTWFIDNATASAWYVPWAGLRQPATSGRITVTSVDSSHKLSGSVELESPPWHVATAFNAAFIPSGIFCA